VLADPAGFDLPQVLPAGLILLGIAFLVIGVARLGSFPPHNQDGSSAKTRVALKPRWGFVILGIVLALVGAVMRF
jgi:hypothetical protein